MGEEIDDEEAVNEYDCNASEIYRESETNLYVCRWSKYSHALCFYEQKLYDRDLMPNGIFHNLPAFQAKMENRSHTLNQQYNRLPHYIEVCRPYTFCHGTKNMRIYHPN